jgi:hypothetical protein
VNPLKQALSGLGPLAGYVAPQQAALGRHGRSSARTFRLASNDNVAAIQSLPAGGAAAAPAGPPEPRLRPRVRGLLQRGPARPAGALRAQQGRADQIEATLPSTEQTAQQQLDVLQSGFQDTVDALEPAARRLAVAQPGPRRGGQRTSRSIPARWRRRFAPQLAAQQQGNQLIASVSDAVRLGTAAQTDAIGRMTNVLADRLDRLERTIRLLQDGRLGNAA